MSKPQSGPAYNALLTNVSSLLAQARRASSRAVNAILVVTYWEIGRRIVKYEQCGAKRAQYGKALLKQLSKDLSKRFGRGFSERNLLLMRKFFQEWPISQTASAKSPDDLLDTSRASPPTVSADPIPSFPLPWSHYVRLLSLEDRSARRFYEEEALRGGWSERQLARQIDSQFFERARMSRNKAGILKKGRTSSREDGPSVVEEFKDPLVLEFLDLKDEYSESDLEGALVHRLESFLLELGGAFTFVGRQKRLRVDNEWYRVDLVLFHRVLRCLVIVDLKLGKLNHADIGQMHLYLNYARAHWTHKDENPPVGLILCASKGETLAKYALEGLPNKVLASEYRMTLPKETLLIAELERGRRQFERKE